MKTDMAAASWKQALCTQIKHSIFRIFYCSYMGWATVWPLSKLRKKSRGNLPGFSSRKRDLCVPDRKFWNVFRVPNQKLRTQIFCFGYSVWCQRYCTKTQKRCFWDGMNLGLRGNSPTLNITATSPESLMLHTFFVRYPKKHYRYFKTFGQKFYFRQKNSRRLHRTFVFY